MVPLGLNLVFTSVKIGPMINYKHDAIVIIVLALALIGLNQMDLIPAAFNYPFIPLLIMYFVGKWMGSISRSNKTD